MTDIAIRATGLSKRYRIGGPSTTLRTESRARYGYKTLRDTLTNAATAPLRRLASVARGRSSTIADQTIWALKDVSFEVQRGDVVGIIGRNGAGKTTLLRVLSRITRPTEGYAEIHGRVGSLLDVGTGFHPELTGRENIYLNGAILGMKRAEIDRRFDEIVAFSEIGRFIDTPVKHYSSGMRVRLAFAVAAHLEPEILLVDEVLAVGDLAFQKKCLGKMGEVARGGRTVLFVSHNMAAVRRLCQRAVLLDEGRARALGDVDDIVSRYESDVLSSFANRSDLFPIVNHRYGLSLESAEVQVVPEGEHAHLRIKVRLKSERRLGRVGIGIRVHTHGGALVAKLPSWLTEIVIQELDGTCSCTLECQTIEQFLASGEYSLGLTVGFPGTEHIIVAEHIASFCVPDHDHFGSGKVFTLSRHGLVPLPMRVKEINHC